MDSQRRLLESKVIESDCLGKFMAEERAGICLEQSVSFLVLYLSLHQVNGLFLDARIVNIVDF